MNVSRTFAESLESRRLLAHIGIDPEFNGSGYAPVGGSLLMAPLTGGKILAVSAEVVRLNSDGEVDQTFVDRGATFESPRTNTLAALAGQQLFIGGTIHYTDENGAPYGTAAIFVRKLNLKTGATNAGFGAEGLVDFVPPAQINDRNLKDYFAPTSMIATPDGGVIVSVSEQYGNYPNTVPAVTLHKFGADGKPDANFGNEGVVIVDILDEYGYLNGLQLTGYADGRFLVVGGLESEQTLTRYKANGKPDSTFGTNGVINLSGYSSAYGFALIQSDGKILINRSASDISGYHQYGSILRFNSDGTPDSGFGTNGVLSLTRGSDDWDAFYASEIALDPQGRIVGIGQDGTDGESADYYLFRLTSGGDADASFDDDGFSVIPPQFDAGYGFTLGFDAGGQILVGRGNTVSRFIERDRVALSPDGHLYIDGSDGDDTVASSLMGDNVILSFNEVTDSIPAASIKAVIATGALGDDRIQLDAIDADMTVTGGKGNDVIITAGGADSIKSAWGDDTVSANGGNDFVNGDSGDDSLYGGEGNDTMFGEYGEDSIAGGGGNDRLFGGWIEPRYNDEYTSGDDGSDSLSGNAGNDTIDGGRSSDRVAGNGGRDRLLGGDGNDRIYGGAAGDWLYGAADADQLFGEGGLDRLYADDEGVGYDSVDTLHGNAGDDIMVSRDGAMDQLFGDGGHDTSYADALDALTSIEVIL